MEKLTEDYDIVAYFTTFERLMSAYEVKRERWVFKLAPTWWARLNKRMQL